MVVRKGRSCRGRESVTALIVNDGDALEGAACAGMGLAYMLEDLATPFLKSGTLVEVLADGCPPFSGYHAFYSSRRHPPHAFTLFLEALRQEANSRVNGTTSR
ncbi:LysR substrate-binding domain-containing protein [Celeribacter baekdonensis]|uniref:LysR substrate-binding domain-containing protein n=1 Tax=Celeribacter baekdonensis TaxID=875171 RepID=UPI003A910D2F